MNQSVVSVVRRPVPVLAKQVLVVLTAIGALGACTTLREGRLETGVLLVEPFEIAPVSSLSGMLAVKFKTLAKIDPDHPLSDEAVGQTLSMFGREDLIAATSKDYRSDHCAPLTTASNVFQEIEAKARQTSIVIINESHERSQHRDFTAELARRLRPLGYDILAIETLSNSVPSTPAQYMPMFVRQPNLPYLVDEDG